MVAIPVWLIYATIAIALASAIYSVYQMRKMQKKNGASASQLDGSLADEGQSFSDIAGSPHMYVNYVDKFGGRVEDIKTKGGK